MMKPGQNYADQAKRSPRLIDKDVYVEQVLNDRHFSITKIETKSLLNSVSQLGINSSPS
jgi:SpoVK/Ycf46/Vps4 family AAA+-type ATPase